MSELPEDLKEKKQVVQKVENAEIRQARNLASAIMGGWNVK